MVMGSVTNLVYVVYALHPLCMYKYRGLYSPIQYLSFHKKNTRQILKLFMV